jgi:DNA-binding PadR family transcriptional regulator
MRYPAVLGERVQAARGGRDSGEKEEGMTLNDALILSYVKRGIGYGYNILSHVRESRSDEWVDFSRAGLYKTLDKLERAGFLIKTLEQNRARPPKKVYRITSTGESALAEYLTSGFDFGFLTKYELDAYLVTAVAASPDAVILAETIRKRIESVKIQMESLKNDWPEDKDSYPFIVYVLYKRRMEFLSSELSWLSWLEGVLMNVSGDVLHSTWAETTV